MCKMGFPGGSVVKNLPINAGYVGLIAGSRMFPGEENGNPLQYSYLGNPMDRGAWQATAHRVTKSQTWLKWQHACRHVVIRELWHPSGNGWCHIQAELGGHYSGIQGSFSRVGIQSNMVSFSPCHYLTLESCWFCQVSCGGSGLPLAQHPCSLLVTTVP